MAVAIGNTPSDPPFLQGDQFTYECTSPLLYSLDANLQTTTCESDGSFTRDAAPPTCDRTCKFCLFHYVTTARSIITEKLHFQLPFSKAFMNFASSKAAT